jgi:outer membrane protein, protease secretion system
MIYPATALAASLVAPPAPAHHGQTLRRLLRLLRLMTLIAAVLPTAAAVLGAALLPAPAVAQPQTGGNPVMPLREAYQLALPHDARIKAAQAAYRASQEQLPQARSQLQPNLSLGATRLSNRLESTAPNILGQINSSKDQYVSYNQSLTLRQALYRPGSMAAVRVAEANVQAAQARRDQELTAVAARVASAYLDLLLAQEQLQFATEQVRTVDVQLAAARQSFAAGTGTRTDVDDLLAQADLARADALDAAQYRQYAEQQLATVLGGQVIAPAPLVLPDLAVLLDPEQAPLAQWLEQARARSAELRTLTFQLSSTQADIDRAQSGHKPTLDALLQRTRSGNENVTRIQSSYDNTSVGLQLSIPLYSGGVVTSQTRQAVAEWEKTGFLLEATQLDLDGRVRKEFRAVVEGISRHKALQQALASSQTALQSAQRSFEAGVRTRVDIARAAQRLATVQRDLAQTAYGTVMARLRLALLTAGTEADSAQAIEWLDRVVYSQPSR